MCKRTPFKNVLSTIDKHKQISLIVNNYCRVFSDVTDKTLRIEHITQTLSLLNVPPVVIAVAFQRLSMTQSEMPTLTEILDVIKSIERTVGLANNAPKPMNAWHEVIRHLSAISPPSWSHPFIEQTVHDIGVRLIIENEDLARDLFVSKYKDLCDDELNRLLLELG